MHCEYDRSLVPLAYISIINVLRGGQFGARNDTCFYRPKSPQEFLITRSRMGAVGLGIHCANFVNWRFFTFQSSNQYLLGGQGLVLNSTVFIIFRLLLQRLLLRALDSRCDFYMEDMLGTLGSCHKLSLC